MNKKENQTLPSIDELNEYIELLTIAKEKAKELKEITSEDIDIRFFGIRDVMRILGCCELTAQKLFNDPEFPSENYGKEKRILVSEFVKFFSIKRDKNESIYWQDVA